MVMEKPRQNTRHRSPEEHPVSLTPLVVRTSELDSFGHVNHAVYLTYFEHARFQALSEAGFDWSVLDDRGWAIFVVRVEVDYLAEAGREDELLIRTQAESFRRTSMLLAQDIVRDDGFRHGHRSGEGHRSVDWPQPTADARARRSAKGPDSSAWLTSAEYGLSPSATYRPFRADDC